MFEIFHLQSNAYLKAGLNALDNFYLKKFEFWTGGKGICSGVYI